MNIDIIYDSRNFTIIQDTITRNIWLYSFQNPIAEWDGKRIYINKDYIKSQTDKMHISNFKNILKNGIDIITK